GRPGRARGGDRTARRRRRAPPTARIRGSNSNPRTVLDRPGSRGVRGALRGAPPVPPGGEGRVSERGASVAEIFEREAGRPMSRAAALCGDWLVTFGDRGTLPSPRFPNLGPWRDAGGVWLAPGG